MVSFRRLTIASAFAVLVLYGGLIGSLVWFLDRGTQAGALFSERTLFSVRLSLAAATIASFLALLVAVPASYALSRSSFPGRNLVDTLLEFPIIVSPAALGAILLIFFTNPAGSWFEDRVAQIVFAFPGIVIAQFVTVLGVAVRFMKTAFDEVPREYEAVARSLGASPFRAFRTVSLPLARRGLVAAFVLSWAKAMGEFGATITVAGTMAMKTETLPVAIYMRLASADVGGAVALILLLLAIGLSALFLVRFLTRERRVA